MHNPIPRLWRTPLILICLSLVPFMITAIRLASIGGPEVETDPNLIRFGGSFEMLILHILSGSLFLLLSAMQFSSGIRLANPVWHRRCGKIAMATGIVAGASGIWLILAFPPSELATPTMDVLRILFGMALIVFILMALRAIRQRNMSRHRAWMIRAFALAIAGTTQAFIVGAWMVLISPLTPQSATVLIVTGYLINIAFAERQIRIHPIAATISNPQRTPL